MADEIAEFSPPASETIKLTLKASAAQIRRHCFEHYSALFGGSE
jgi:hypothetical protein